MSRRTVMTVIMGLMTGAFVHAAAPVWGIDLDQVIGASSARYLFTRRGECVGCSVGCASH